PGTWSPATVDNTADGTYTFTAAVGECPNNPAPTIDVTVIPNIIPTFSFPTTICQNDVAPLLPLISDNGITGTWDIPTIDNTTDGIYTFTADLGQCTNPAPPINVTVRPYETPTFSFPTTI